MFVVDDIFSAKYTKDNSIFLSYLMPIERFDRHLAILKKEHKKAVHFVRASRILNEYSQIVEYSSDDGEPRGSSGVPVLNVMRGNELINCAIIVVRYFGGRLLGVGGLVRAYTNAAQYVINDATLSHFESMIVSSATLPLNRIELAKYWCKKLEIDIIKFDFMQNFAIIHFKSSASKTEKLLSALQIEV